LNVKKIIAREILILLIAIGIGFLVFLGTFGYNFYKESISRRLEKQIDNAHALYNRLDYQFDYKQRNHIWYFDRMDAIFLLRTNYDTNTEQKFWDYTRGARHWQNIDSVTSRWNGKWAKIGVTQHFKEIGFSTPKQLQRFFLDKSISTKDSLDHKNALLVVKDLEVLNEKLTRNEESKMNFVDQKAFFFNA
jgi:hypothetical protein